MAFSQTFLEEIKERSDIEETIGRYVLLKRAGSNLVGLCPFHNEKTPSFTVFTATRSFYCFGCGAGGDVVSFVMKADGLDYPQAIELLARNAGIQLEESTGYSPASGVKKSRIIEMNTVAARFFRSMLFSTQGAAAAKYLQERGFTELTVKRFGLGYAPDSWNQLHDHLLKAGFTGEEMKAGFLCSISKHDRYFDIFRNRIMFPVFDIQGDVVAFSGRRLNEADDRKYINTSDTTAFKKSKILFGMNIAKNSAADGLVLCEGAPDAIALHQAGFPNAVATLGTALTGEHARLIARFTKNVTLAYDIDGAGRAATLKGIDLLLEVGVETRIIDLGANVKDPDEYIKKYGADAFRKRLNDSSGQIDYKINEIMAKYDLENPDEKMQALNELSKFAATLYSKSEREIYTGRIAQKLSLTNGAVLSEIERKFAANERKRKKEFAANSMRAATGFGDRVNREKLQFTSASMVEEAVLGILLLCPELGVPIKAKLQPDSFLTAFNRKIYELFQEDFAAGREAVLSKNGILTPEETGRVSKYMADRKNSDNSTEILNRLIAQLDAQREKQAIDAKISEDPIGGLTEYLNSLKK